MKQWLRGWCIQVVFWIWPEMRDRVIDGAAAKVSMTPDEVRAQMREGGLIE